jgi:hypothetical protein
VRRSVGVGEPALRTQPYSLINGTLVATSDYAYTGLSGGVTYYYVVTAENTGAQESGYSNEASAIPYSILIAVGDSFILENKPNATGGNNVVIRVRTNHTGLNNRGLVQFDVSSIPAGSSVNLASLTLCATQVPNSPRTFQVFAITQSWTQGTVTWNNQSTTEVTASDTRITPASVGCMTWVLTSDVQAFVNGTKTNYGWLIMDAVESAATNYLTKFRSTNDATVPAEQPRL